VDNATTVAGGLETAGEDKMLAARSAEPEKGTVFTCQEARIPGRAEASIRATASWNELEDIDGMAVDSTLGNSPGMETGAEDG